ncbi:MAG: hypothetical protein OFPII_26050 [Osedax symbiont Rs1]|nr:MAG: hypothetical protein OFPII_26050 [Osedax symbiont Rs1]
MGAESACTNKLLTVVDAFLGGFIDPCPFISGDTVQAVVKIANSAIIAKRFRYVIKKLNPIGL